MYRNFTAAERDKLCSHEGLIENNNQLKQKPKTMKRQGSHSGGENVHNSLIRQDEKNYAIQPNQGDETPGGTKRLKKSISGVHESSQRSLVFSSKERTQKENSINGAEQQNEIDRQQKKTTENDMNYRGQEISSHALHYAAEQHLPPIRITCDPKINDHSQGISLIKQIFLYIEKEFRQINKKYKHSLGFEYWFVDKNGNLVCFTREPELFVYLCDVKHYPKVIQSINISPEIPKHLPPQYSVILKSVSNSINYDDLLDEIKNICPSVFKLEELNGTRREQSRHIRLDLKDKCEYEKIIGEGVLSIYGQFIEVNEFLAPPRLLICTKCNDPGHIRKNCTFAYDACRRCGHDRSEGEHNECQKHCHHCDSDDHMATDFKCPYIAEYRKKLVFKLKQHPELLPPNIQLFVPTECRQRGESKVKTMCNREQQNQPYVYDPEVWNSLPQAISKMPYRHAAAVNVTNNSVDNSHMWEEIKRTRNDYESLKSEMEKNDAEVKVKFEQQNIHFQQALSIATQLVQQQTRMLEQFTKVINETLSTVQKVVISIDGLKNNGGQKETISALLQTCQSLTDQFNTFIQQMNFQYVQIFPLIMNKRNEEVNMPQDVTIRND